MRAEVADRAAPGASHGWGLDRAGRTIRLGLLGWLAWLALGVPSTAWALELPELMAVLGQRRSGEARFVEERRVSGLDAPLSFSGTLRFRAPDRLERHTLQPQRESFVVDGRQLTLERGGRTRQLTIDGIPELAALVGAMRGTLTGDSAALRRHFWPKVQGTLDDWTLVLQPRDEQLGSLVQTLLLQGQRSDLRTVTTLMADGDRSVMRIEPMAAGAGPAGATAAPGTPGTAGTPGARTARPGEGPASASGGASAARRQP